jgi:F0F1-type ATP synthase assembly protein I
MDHGSSQGPTDAGLRGRDLLSLGSLLVGAVVGGTLLGLLLDSLLGTSPVFVVVGVMLGILGAGLGFWVKVRDALRP